MMQIIEIGLLIYPQSQLAAVYGLTDLFRIADQQADLRAAEGQESPAAPMRRFRVSHWQVDEVLQQVCCVWDSDPTEPHHLSHVIAPPSIAMPRDMPPMQVAADWMKGQHAQGATLCSVCAGAFVLAETGLVDGRRATTHWAFADTLAQRFPAVEVTVSEMVIDDGDIMTAGGILAWTDLGLTLVARFMGTGVMLDTARFLLIDPPGRTQQPFAAFIPRFEHGDTGILRVQHQLHAHPSEAVNIPELAREARMTERTFMRRFAKATGLRPTEYVQQVRIAKARDALELTQLPIDQIAWSVGYTDLTAFRKIFSRITGTTPGEYRHRFAPA